MLALPKGMSWYWSESGDSVAIHEGAVAGIAVPAGQSVLFGCAHIALVVDDGAIGNNLEAYSQNPKDDSCDGVDCGLEC